MTDNESSDMHDDDEVFEAEVVDDDEHAADEAADEVVEIDEVTDEAGDEADGDMADQAGDETGDEEHADALAALAGGGPAAGADALEAMATGDDAPTDAIAAAEARDAGDAGDALASLAAGESLGDDPGDDPADETPDAEDPAEAFAFAADEHIHVDPARIREVRKQQNRRAAAVHSTSFKKTMIPMLLVVGVLLLGIGVITGAMKGDPKAAGATIMDKYGTPMMAASLVLGLVLIAGAILFHQDVRRTQAQEAQAREMRDRELAQPESDEPSESDE